jgi:hypothetical protein
VNHLSAYERLNAKEVAPTQLEAVRSEGVDLLSGVRPANQPIPCSSSAMAANDEHISVPGHPLALNAREPPVEIEDEIAPRALINRRVDVDPEHGPMLVAGSDN